MRELLFSMEVNFLRKKWSKALFAGMMAAFLEMQITSASAMPPIMPVSDIYKGMTGTAYTVMDETGELRSFDVEIIGISRSGTSMPYIMVRAYGPLMEENGGILQGMSGSPVYVDDYLVGAVSIGFKDMKRTTFFLTPAEEMVKLWDMPDDKNKVRKPLIDLKAVAEKKRADEEKEQKEKEQKEKEDAGTESQQEETKPLEEGTGKKEVPAEEKEADSEENVSAEEKTPAEETKASAEESSADEDEAQVDSTEKTSGEETSEEAASAEETAEELPEQKAEEGTSPVGVQADGQLEEKAVFTVSGFDDAGMSYLKEHVFKHNESLTDAVLLGTAGAGSENTEFAGLVPGSPVGVALACGDYNVGATGTVTAVDGNRVLAFGHSYMHTGNVSYFMTDATVLGGMSGPTAGMKMSNIGRVIGRVSQDRTAGIAGEMGVYPLAIPVNVHVKDNTLGVERTYGTRIVYDETLLPQLSASMTYSSMSQVSDGLSGCSADVSFSIRTDAAENGMAKRRNIFYNATDVGQVAVLDLIQAMNILCSDAEKESEIVGVQVDVTMAAERRTAALISATPDKPSVKPGETVNFKTVIHPYRKENETLTIPYTVPKNQLPGTLHLDIRGGGLIPVAQLAAQNAGALLAEDGAPVSTKEKLRGFLQTGSNNEIIISPGAPAVPLSEKEQKKAIKAAIKAAKENPAQEERKVNLLGTKKETASKETRFATDYIIENVVHSVLQVEKTGN